MVGWTVQEGGGQQNPALDNSDFRSRPKIVLESAKQKLDTFLCIKSRDRAAGVEALSGGRGSTDVLQLLIGTGVREQQAGDSLHNKGCSKASEGGCLSTGFVCAELRFRYTSAFSASEWV